MGRIVTNVKIENTLNPEFKLSCNALVDTGSAYIVLPTAWKKRLGELTYLGNVDVELGDQSRKTAEICGPVKVNLEGFRSFFSEVLFVEMNNKQGSYEPLIGYIPLEQSQAAVDMVGHRLIPVKSVDLKTVK